MVAGSARVSLAEGAESGLANTVLQFLEQDLEELAYKRRRAARLKAWGSCDCGRWDKPTAEPWSHTPVRCQPLREQMRGYDR